MEPATGVQCLLCKYHLVWSVGAAVGLALAFVVPAAYHEQPLVSLLLFGGPAQASPRTHPGTYTRPTYWWLARVAVARWFLLSQSHQHLAQVFQADTNQSTGFVHLATWGLWVSGVLLHVGGHAVLMLWPLLCPHKCIANAGKMHRIGMLVAIVGAGLLLCSGTASLQQFQTQLVLSGVMLVVQQEIKSRFLTDLGALSVSVMLCDAVQGVMHEVQWSGMQHALRGMVFMVIALMLVLIYNLYAEFVPRPSSKNWVSPARLSQPISVPETRVDTLRQEEVKAVQAVSPLSTLFQELESGCWSAGDARLNRVVVFRAMCCTVIAMYASQLVRDNTYGGVPVSERLLAHFGCWSCLVTTLIQLHLALHHKRFYLQHETSIGRGSWGVQAVGLLIVHFEGWMQDLDPDALLITTVYLALFALMHGERLSVYATKVVVASVAYSAMDLWGTPKSHHMHIGMCDHACCIIVLHTLIILLSIGAFMYIQRVARKATLIASSASLTQERSPQVVSHVEQVLVLSVVDGVTAKQPNSEPLTNLAAATSSSSEEIKPGEVDLYVSVQPVMLTPNQVQESARQTTPGLASHLLETLLGTVVRDSSYAQNNLRADGMSGELTPVPHRLADSAADDSLHEGANSIKGTDTAADSYLSVVQSASTTAEALTLQVSRIAPEALVTGLALARLATATVQEMAATPDTTKAAESQAVSDLILINKPQLAVQDFTSSAAKGAFRCRLSHSKHNLSHTMLPATGYLSVSRGGTSTGNSVDNDGNILDSSSAFDFALPEWKSVYGAISPELFQQRQIEARDYTISLVCIVGSVAITLPLIAHAGTAQKLGADFCFALVAAFVFVASTVAKLLHTAGLQQRSVFVVRHRNFIWTVRFLVLHPLRNYLFHAAGFEAMTLMLHCIVSCAVLGLLVISESHFTRAIPLALLLVYGTYLHDGGMSSSLTKVAIHVVLFTICCYTARSLSACLVHRLSAFAQRCLRPLKQRRVCRRGSSNTTRTSDSESLQEPTPPLTFGGNIYRHWGTTVHSTCLWCSNPTVIAIAATMLLEIGHTLVALAPRRFFPRVAGLPEVGIISFAESGIIFVWQQATVISSRADSDGLSVGLECLQQFRLGNSSVIMGMFLICCLIAVVFKLWLLIASMGKDPRHGIYSLALPHTAEQLQALSLQVASRYTIIQVVKTHMQQALSQCSAYLVLLEFGPDVIKCNDSLPDPRLGISDGYLSVHILTESTSLHQWQLPTRNEVSSTKLPNILLAMQHNTPIVFERLQSLHARIANDIPAQAACVDVLAAANRGADTVLIVPMVVSQKTVGALYILLPCSSILDGDFQLMATNLSALLAQVFCLKLAMEQVDTDERLIQDVMPLDVAAKLKHRFHSSLDSAAHLAHFKIHPVHTAPQLESDNAFITVASDLTSPTYAPPSAFCDIASAVLGLGALLSLEHTEQVLSFSESVQGQAQTLAPRLLSGSKSLPARFLPPGEAVATSHLRHQPAQMGVVYSSWHENVCVLFADIVGYTPLSMEMAPQQVMLLLHELFSKYDALLEADSVYKVETIGDCYMCATNLVVPDVDAASHLVHFGQEMVKAASTVLCSLNGSTVQIRVGIHCGTVMSGIVGQVRARYCLFGDVVNTAARMEATGLPQMIQITEDMYHQLPAHQQLQWQSRGEIEVKGKGKMMTFLQAPPTE